LVLGPSVEVVPAGSSNTVAVPAGVIRPMSSLSLLTYQTLPSGPAMMPRGSLAPAPAGKVVMVPAVVIRPMRSLSLLVNQRLPSGPTVMSRGPSGLPAPPTPKVTIVAAGSATSGSMRPIRLLTAFVY
jgi:hypothetical protein